MRDIFPWLKWMLQNPYCKIWFFIVWFLVTYVVTWKLHIIFRTLSMGLFLLVSWVVFRKK